MGFIAGDPTTSVPLCVTATLSKPTDTMGCVGSKNGMGGPAYKASHTGTYACSAEAMWKSLSQWEPDYLTKVDKPAGELKDVKGSGVGATRTVVAAGPDGTVAEWGEKVTAFDAEKMTYSYRVTSAVPFPIGVETFLWTCKVKSLGPNKCEATVGCVFDSEAPDAMMGMLPAMYACRAILAQFCAILLRRLLLYRYKTWPTARSTSRRSRVRRRARRSTSAISCRTTTPTACRRSSKHTA